MGRMPRTGTASPSFFKVMLGDFLTKVCLPRAFVKNIHGEIPKKVTLTSTNGKSWSASVKNIGKDWFLCEKWSTFAKENSLEYGEFLVFILNGHANFTVTIYKTNALEKVFPSAENATSESASTGTMSSTPPRPIRSDARKISRFTTTLGLSARYQVALPCKFARENGFKERNSVILVDQFGVSWPVKIIHSKVRGTILSSGWNMFRITRNLHLDDSCEFEYEKGMGNVIRVNTAPAETSEGIEVPRR